MRIGDDIHDTEFSMSADATILKDHQITSRMKYLSCPKIASCKEYIDMVTYYSMISTNFRNCISDSGLTIENIISNPCIFQYSLHGSNGCERNQNWNMPH